MALASDLMGVGIPAAPAAMIGVEPVTLAATGTTQGTAAPLVGSYHVCTTSGSAYGVIVPADAPLQKEFTVVNSSAVSLSLYPFVGGSFDALAANAAISLPRYTSICFVRTTRTQLRLVGGNNLPSLLGSSGTQVSPNALVTFDATQAATGNNTTATALFTYTLPVNCLAPNGRGLRVKAFGTFGATANNKTVALTFGATTVVSTGAVAGNNVAWFVEGLITRTSTSAQLSLGTAQWGTTNITPNVATPAENLAGTVGIVVTGTNGTAAANDIVYRGCVIEALG